jgi:hypothetical protein
VHPQLAVGAAIIDRLDSLGLGEADLALVAQRQVGEIGEEQVERSDTL